MYDSPVALDSGFETPLLARTAPALPDDLAWEDYLVLDAVGAAQAEAEWWAATQPLPAPVAAAVADGVPRGTALIAAAVADLNGAELAGFLATLPAPAGVDGASVIDAMVGFEKVARWAQAMQLRWIGELAARREDPRTGWARDTRDTQGLGNPADPTAAAALREAPATNVAAAEAPRPSAVVAATVSQRDSDRRRTPGEDLLGRVGEHAAAEVAFALHTTRRAATDLLHAAVTLTRRLPHTLHALELGDVSTRAAVVAAEETDVLDPAAVAAVDSVLPDRISGATVPQARAKIRRAVLSADPAAAAARETRARRCRSFDVDRRVIDGMGTFGGYAPIEDVLAIDERVDALARAAKAPGDPRSAGARRMDVVTDLLLGRPLTTADGTVLVQPAPPRTWKVDVVVAESTLRGADSEPGDLPGYGPITAPTARRLAGLPGGDAHDGANPNSNPNQDPGGDSHDNGCSSGHSGRRDDGTDPPWPAAVRAVWRRLVTDPLSGIVRDYGTTRYRPPTALADLIRARDRYCYAPGCRQVAARCELDHLKNSPAGPSPHPHPDGATADHNMGPGCPYHHRIKPRPGWNVTSPAPGAYVWTTPTGHTYTRHAERPLDPPIYDRDTEPAPPF